jgi:nucleotide-binding universal stress UspA family protein
MKLLIATDGSADAAKAMQTAIRITKSAERCITLFCCAPGYGKAIGKRAYEQRVRTHSNQILEAARAASGIEDGTIQLVSALGSAARVILKRSTDYDLTVIGAKGAGAGANVGLGPVARSVVEHATAPVLIGRELKSDIGLRILIPADGSDASRTAVQTLLDDFDLQSSSVTLLHVAETPWIHVGLDENWSTYGESEQEKSDAGVFEKEMSREAEAILEQTRDLLRGTGVAIETSIVQGIPSDEILSEAERGQYDLIVMGASGNQDLKHSMLGSVSFKVAWNAACSVLIVREPA